jgi:hypothetical protein
MLHLSLIDNLLQKDEKPCCVIFSYKTKNNYIPMIIGMDYTHNKELGVYRQALYQVVLLAKREGKNKISLGFSAGTEKYKLGAKGTPVYAYMHTKDSYNMEAISAISAVSNFPAS